VDRRISLGFLIVYLPVLGLGVAYGQYQGPFAVEIDPVEITFNVDGPPGIYDANLPVSVSVSSGFSDWSLQCQASALIEGTHGGVIPPSRIYLSGLIGDISTGDEPLISLDQPVVVGDGSFTGPDFVPIGMLDFKMESEWDDRPGTYIGQITFTYLAVP
jgi:hypothetical protein